MKSIISLISLLILILIFTGCGQEPTPTLYENFNSGNNPPPVVTSIEPADSAYMGVDVITINGNYFAPGLLNDSNLVSFNGVKGEIIEATATQLKVRVPMLNTDLMALKDSVVGIKVWSRGSSLFSDSLVYKIKAPVKLYATIDPNVKTINRGITVDQSENLFVSVFNDNVMMITPNGSITAIGNEIPGNPALNIPNHKIKSSRFFAQTYAPATKKTPGADKLTSNVRVVPNPYIISADPNNLLYPGEENKLAFVNIPGECTIKIYSEIGELIDTINHNDGSGAAFWYSTTSSNQFVVSGLYIAVITDDKTGDREIVKFVVIR